MARTRFFRFILLLLLLLLLLVAPLATAQAACPETASGFHTYLGVDVTLPDYPDYELLLVQVVWVPPDPESRFRDQHVIDIDWKERTTTNVSVWDGELQAVSARDIQPVMLQTNTDFETGQVHLETCTGVLDSAGPGLVFAYYGNDGSIEPRYTRVSPLIALTAVTNVSVSEAITNAFKYQLAPNMIEDIERATGVLPGHYLAESFLFQNLSPTTLLLDKTPSLFFAAKNATVYQNRLYVTGSEASASVPLSLAAVYSDGEDILDADHRVRNLEQYIGTVRFQSRFRGGWIGYNQVIEARPDLRVETQPCEDGYTTLTADFLYPSEVPGYIWLYIGNSLDLVALETSINERVSCENDYRLESSREIEIRKYIFRVVWAPVATTGTFVRVVYDTPYTSGIPDVHNDYRELVVASPSIGTVLKVWDAPNIESLYGNRVFTCDIPGDSRVDSIDEIADRRESLLTAAEKASFGPYSDPGLNNKAWGDGDGDGSICNVGELRPNGDGRSITEITLAVYPPGG